MYIYLRIGNAQGMNRDTYAKDLCWISYRIYRDVGGMDKKMETTVS